MVEVSTELINEINTRATACDLRVAIRDEMYKQKYSVYHINQLLEASGNKISRDCLYRYLSGQTRLNSDTLNVICAILDLQLQ
jgi:hypothetical protein